MRVDYNYQWLVIVQGLGVLQLDQQVSASIGMFRGIHSAGSKRRAADAAVSNDVITGRGSYKKINAGTESNANPEETLQQAVSRLDNVKACKLRRWNVHNWCECRVELQRSRTLTPWCADSFLWRARVFACYHVWKNVCASLYCGPFGVWMQTKTRS